MKNRHYEILRHRMRQYHRDHQWRLEDGLFIPHTYPGDRFLSWWDDVGFILNGRRIMVWWIHPRMKYADAIEEMAWKEAGDPPMRGADLFESTEKQWVKVGRSRKKVVSYRSAPTPEAQKNYYERLRVIEERISRRGRGGAGQTQALGMEAREPIPGQLVGLMLGCDAILGLEVDADELAVARHERRGNAQLKPVGTVMVGKVGHGSISEVGKCCGCRWCDTTL